MSAAMKTVTRCPGCHTTFLVRREQLEAREGRVRCGACGTVFDARASLEVMDEAPGALVTPPPVPATTATPATTSARAATGSEADARDELFEDAQPILLDMGPMPAGERPAGDPFLPAEPAAASEEVATLVLPGRVVPPREDGPAAATEPLFAEDAGETAAEARASTVADVAPPVPGDADAPPGDAAAEGLTGAPDGRASADAATSSVPRAPDAPETAQAPEAETGERDESARTGSAIVFRTADDSAPLPDFDAERREQRRIARTWALACVPVALLLALQLALHWRAELGAMAPGLRGVLGALCAPFRCEVELPQHANLLTLEGTNLEADAGGTLTLYATLRNRARYEQALPAIELTLTDPRDQPLARRLLSPRDYSPARREGIAAGGEIAVKVAIEASAVKAAGFRAEAVYP